MTIRRALTTGGLVFPPPPPAPASSSSGLCFPSQVAQAGRKPRPGRPRGRLRRRPAPQAAAPRPRSRDRTSRPKPRQTPAAFPSIVAAERPGCKAHPRTSQGILPTHNLCGPFGPQPPLRMPQRLLAGPLLDKCLFGRARRHIGIARPPLAAQSGGPSGASNSKPVTSNR